MVAFYKISFTCLCLVLLFPFFLGTGTAIGKNTVLGGIEIAEEVGEQGRGDIVFLNARDTTFMALMVYYHDIDRQRNDCRVVLFGAYSNGLYTPLECEQWEDTLLLNNSRLAIILRAHPFYTVFKDGGKTADYLVTKLWCTYFQCTLFAAGYAIPRRLYKVDTSFTEMAHMIGADGEYCYDLRIAVNSECQSAKYSSQRKSFEISLDSEYENILSCLEKSFPQKKDSIKLIPDKTVRLVPLSIDRQGSKTYLAVYHQDFSDSNLSSSMVIRSTSKGMEVLLNEKAVNDLGAWGDGYTYIGSHDVDNDGTDELFFTVNGYESLSIEVYKMRGGKYVEVMRTFLWGC